MAVGKQPGGYGAPDVRVKERSRACAIAAAEISWKHGQQAVVFAPLIAKLRRGKASPQATALTIDSAPQSTRKSPGRARDFLDPHANPRPPWREATVGQPNVDIPPSPALTSQHPVSQFALRYGVTTRFRRDNEMTSLRWVDREPPGPPVSRNCLRTAAREVFSPGKSIVRRRRRPNPPHCCCLFSFLPYRPRPAAKAATPLFCSPTPAC
jgi:hypothetical protein